MPADTFTLIATSYADVTDATADYESVLGLWRSADIGGTFDVAVVTHRPDGKVKVVRHLERPTVQGVPVDLGLGLAVGALAAVVPAVAIGAGVAVGGATGAGIGALAGHVVGGMSRSDLRDLGELVDEGHSVLVVVAAEDAETWIADAITRGAQTLRTQLRADEPALEEALEEAIKAASP